MTLSDYLKQLRERCEKATPGPWSWVTVKQSGLVTESTLDGPKDCLCRYWYESRGPDSEFIAAARSDIPRLLKLVEIGESLYELLPDDLHACRRWEEAVREIEKENP